MLHDLKLNTTHWSQHIAKQSSAYYRLRHISEPTFTNPATGQQSAKYRHLLDNRTTRMFLAVDPLSHGLARQPTILGSERHVMGKAKSA